jgi:hypothetical protein
MQHGPDPHVRALAACDLDRAWRRVDADSVVAPRGRLEHVPASGAADVQDSTADLVEGGLLGLYPFVRRGEVRVP